MKKSRILSAVILLGSFCSNVIKAQSCGSTVSGTCGYSGIQGSTGNSLYTSNGTLLVSTLIFPPLLGCEINTALAVVANRPGVTAYEPCPTSAYNCHGYAWHKAFYGQPNYNNPQNVWIPGSEVPKYWSDGSFYEVFSPPVNAKGVILYYDQGAITHSAIYDPTVSTSMYISKWCAGLLVKHSPTNVPIEYGSPSRYFLRCGACDVAPDLSKLTYNLGAVKYTVNFVAAGGYTMYTNLSRACGLNADMTWTGNGNNWAANWLW